MAKTRVTNVRDYGAIGDDTTDDTTAIIDAVDEADGGEVTFPPPGPYKITGSITGGGNGTRLVGQGREKVWIKNYATDGSPAIIIPANINSYSIEHLLIQGSGAGSGPCIQNGGYFRAVQLIDLLLYPATDAHGMDLGQTGGAIDLYCRDVRINGTNAGAGDGFHLYMDGGTAINTVTLVNCYANDVGAAGYNIYNVSNAALISCSADNSDTGFLLSGGQITAIDPTAEVNASYGFRMASSTGQIILLNPRATGAGGADTMIPFSLEAAGPVQIIFPRTAYVGSGAAAGVVVAAGATGNNKLVGLNNLVGGYSVAAGGVLYVESGDASSLISETSSLQKRYFSHKGREDAPADNTMFDMLNFSGAGGAANSIYHGAISGFLRVIVQGRNSTGAAAFLTRLYHISVFQPSNGVMASAIQQIGVDAIYGGAAAKALTVSEKAGASATALTIEAKITWTSYSATNCIVSWSFEQDSVASFAASYISILSA